MANDEVEITCYGDTSKTTRAEAIKFYLECMMCSEGAERDRYLNIYLQLLNGATRIYS